MTTPHGVDENTKRVPIKRKESVMSKQAFENNLAVEANALAEREREKRKRIMLTGCNSLVGHSLFQ